MLNANSYKPYIQIQNLFHHEQTQIGLLKYTSYYYKKIF